SHTGSRPAASSGRGRASRPGNASGLPLARCTPRRRGPAHWRAEIEHGAQGGGPLRPADEGGAWREAVEGALHVVLRQAAVQEAAGVEAEERALVADLLQHLSEPRPEGGELLRADVVVQKPPRSHVVKVALAQVALGLPRVLARRS